MNCLLKCKNKRNAKKLKKQDLIRIANSSKKLDDIKDNIYEFILLDNAKQFFKKRLCPMRYYTLTQLIKNNVTYINHYVLQFVNWLIDEYKDKISKTNLIKNAYEYIEKNTVVFKYTDLKLYEHQARLFKSIKREGAKLVLYQAPTGTGKTMSPVGLAKRKKVIFTCAAKHIGLQLANVHINGDKNSSCIWLQGCEIRLHYFAAKDFVRHRKTGQIFRVDNSNGEKVELIITDIQSYLPAMNYMLAFNEPEDIVWYWDEPTITLDYDNHDFH